MVPKGYTKITDGGGCCCTRLWKQGNDYYCCCGLMDEPMGHYDTCREGNCGRCGQALEWCNCSTVRNPKYVYKDTGETAPPLSGGGPGQWLGVPITKAADYKLALLDVLSWCTQETDLKALANRVHKELKDLMR